MATTDRKILYWAPRVFGVLYAAAISLYALEEWGTGAGFWQDLAAVIVHLMPAYFVLAALVIAWKKPWAGGILFIILATVFGLIFGQGEPVTVLMMALPPTAIGLLFICDSGAGEPETQPRI